MAPKMTLTCKTKLACLVTSTILTASAAPPSFAGNQENQPPSTQTPIKHIIVIYGENISFDHYFGTYPFAENPKSEPQFVASDDTPCANTLLAAGLLMNNPNLLQPYRLDAIRGLYLRHGSRLHRRAEGIRRRADGQVRPGDERYRARLQDRRVDGDGAISTAILSPACGTTLSALRWTTTPMAACSVRRPWAPSISSPGRPAMP